MRYCRRPDGCPQSGSIAQQLLYTWVALAYKGWRGSSYDLLLRSRECRVRELLNHSSERVPGCPLVTVRHPR